MTYVKKTGFVAVCENYQVGSYGSWRLVTYDCARFFLDNNAFETIFKGKWFSFT